MKLFACYYLQMNIKSKKYLKNKSTLFLKCIDFPLLNIWGSVSMEQTENKFRNLNRFCKKKLQKRRETLKLP